MAAGIGIMFATVLITAVARRPDLGEFARGLFIPRIPQFNEGGFAWTVALFGGVGGTLTILCYGYWMRERGRTSANDLRICRIDLLAAYTMTALFGLAMIVIANGLVTDGRGANFIIGLADQLEQSPLGATGRWLFLIGAWAAVFSSLLGVWQAVPLIFADGVRMIRRRDKTRDEPVSPKNLSYRVYLLALATIPLVYVHKQFADIQLQYAVIGAAFIPLLAIVLLILNGRSAWIGRAHRNHPLTTVVLGLTLILFVTAGVMKVRSELAQQAASTDGISDAAPTLRQESGETP